jgi:hypothetical protein
MTLIRPKALFLTLGLLAVGQVSAQDSMIENVMDACEADLQQYCSQVTPGDGRLVYCVAAHSDKISGECQFALFEAATVLARYSDAILEIAEKCETEIDSLCGDVAVGEGRILACLDEHEAELGEACRTAIGTADAE